MLRIKFFSKKLSNFAFFTLNLFRFICAKSNHAIQWVYQLSTRADSAKIGQHHSFMIRIFRSFPLNSSRNFFFSIVWLRKSLANFDFIQINTKQCLGISSKNFIYCSKFIEFNRMKFIGPLCFCWFYCNWVSLARQHDSKHTIKWLKTLLRETKKKNCNHQLFFVIHKHPSFIELIIGWYRQILTIILVFFFYFFLYSDLALISLYKCTRFYPF